MVARPSAPKLVRVRAAPSAGGVIGVMLFGAALVVALVPLLALLSIIDSPLPVTLLWAALILATGAVIALGYLLFGYFTLGYDLSEDALIIRWANREEAIPLVQIVYAGPAASVLSDRRPGWRWFWPGYYIGTETTAIGRVHVAATQPLSRQLLISTSSAHYAISPERPAAFLERLAQARQGLLTEQAGESARIAGRRQLAEAGWTVEFTPTEALELPRAQATGSSPITRHVSGARQVTRRAMHSRPLRLFLVEDRVGLLFLSLALALNVAMILYLLAQYDQLPQSLVLHWNANGLPDRIGTRRDLWLLPVIMTIVTVANVGLAWLAETFDRFAARLLLAGTGMVQVVAWVALLSIVG